MLRVAFTLVVVAAATIAAADPVPTPPVAPPAAPAAPADGSAAPVDGSAAPSPGSDAAENDYTAAMLAFDAGHYQVAYAGLTKAYERSHRADILFDIARAEKRLGWNNAAIHTFQRFTKEGGATVSKERHAEVIAELVEIHKTVGELTLQVEGGSAAVTVDGHPEGNAPLPEPLLLSPGTHTIVAARGDARDEKTIQIHSLQQAELRLIPFRLDVPGVLTIRTNPDGADLSVDDEPRGHAPWSGSVDEKPHHITASLPDYLTAEKDITVATGKRQDITIDLVHMPVSAPHWYKHWYVIAGAIVIAGTAAAIAGYEATKNDDITILYH
jgi:hypothetical protein